MAIETSMGCREVSVCEFISYCVHVLNELVTTFGLSFSFGILSCDAVTLREHLSPWGEGINSA